MNKVTKPYSTTALGVFVLVPLTLVLLIGWAAIRAERSARASEAALRQVHEQWQVVATLMKSLVEAQTGQRGYLITGNPAFLEPYERAQPQIATSLARLRETANGGPMFSEIEPMVTSLLTVLRENVERARRGERQDAVAAVTAGEGKRRMDAVRAAIGTWAEEVQLTTTKQREQFDAALTLNRRATQAAIGVQALLCALAGYALWRWSKLRGLVVICAWSRTIKHRGEWVTFEEYLWREFGIHSSHGMSPAQVEKFEAQLQQRVALGRD